VISTPAIYHASEYTSTCNDKSHNFPDCRFCFARQSCSFRRQSCKIFKLSTTSSVHLIAMEAKLLERSKCRRCLKDSRSCMQLPEWRYKTGRKCIAQFAYINRLYIHINSIDFEASSLGCMCSEIARVTATTGVPYFTLDSVFVFVYDFRTTVWKIANFGIYGLQSTF